MPQDCAEIGEPHQENRNGELPAVPQQTNSSFKTKGDH